ncbi:hypothetical protein ACFJIW_15390 [Tahibacter sp. UC22_41]|uniref:hypothetical protein n=1 Tax=Tahibacter sp. UC22_41 TaxID=3350178 RepID=UPI0036D954E6
MPLLATVAVSLLATTTASAAFSLAPQAPAASIESICTTATGQTVRLRFESASGDPAAGDQRVVIESPTGDRTTLPLPPASYEARAPLANLKSACSGLTAIDIGKENLLLVLSRSRWPEPAQADAVLIDTKQGRLLDRLADIGAVRRDTGDVFATRAAGPGAIELRLIYGGVPDAGIETDAVRIDEWLRLEVDGDRLRRRWRLPDANEPWSTTDVPAPTAATKQLQHVDKVLCRPQAAPAFTLNFESATGEFDMDDEQPVLVFDDGARLALPVEQASFEARRPLRNRTGICTNVSAFELSAARVLFLLSANARPGYSRAVAVLVDLRERRVLGVTPQLADIKAPSDRYFVTRESGAGALEVRLVREDIADSGIDAAASFAEAWLRFELAGDRLRYRWVAP